MRILANNFFRLGGRRADTCLMFAAGMGVLLLLAGTVSAESRDTPSIKKSETGDGSQPTPEATQPLRRIEAVTWNPVTDELTWVVSAGGSSSGVYKPETTLTYLIHLESATMVFNGESRRFSADEADHVRALVDVLGRYAAESSVWWEAGMGEKVNDANPGPAQKGGGETKHKPSPEPAAVPLANNTPESNSRPPVTQLSGVLDHK